MTFLLLCTGLGFLGHFFSARWGWLLGAIPAAAGLAVMMVGSWVSLIRESKHSLRSPPPCQAGKCTARQYVLVQASKEQAIFRCRCGDLYISEGNSFSSLLPDNSIRPYMVRDSSNAWKLVPGV